MENYLPVYEKVLFERAEAECSCEVSLPEYLPNVAKVVRVCAKSGGRRTLIQENAVLFEETVVFGLLYMSDYKEALKSAVFSCSYTHSFKKDNAKDTLTEGDIECSSFLSDETASILSPRKLSLSCKSQILCQAHTVVKNEVFSDSDKDCFQALKKEAKTLSVTSLAPLRFQLDESISLEEGMPSAQEIIFSDACVYVESKKVNNGGIIYSCRALWSCMYLSGEGENEEYISLGKDIPFTVECEAENLSENAKVICQAEILSCTSDISQNSYGEARIINLALSGNLSAKAYDNQPSLFCRDVFCTESLCECEVKEVQYDSFAGTLGERLTLDESAHANLGNMTEIIACDATVSSLHCERQENKAVLSGKLNVKLTGTTDLGALDSARCVFPIKLSYSAPCDTSAEKCSFDTSVGISSCVCRIENGQVRCICNLILESAQIARRSTVAVTAVKLDEATECSRNKSEYVIYYPGSDDTVWSVSKKYKVSPASLMAINGIEDKGDGVISKKTLVIPR